MKKRFIIWFAEQLRFFADRIDRDHAFLSTGFSFHFEEGVGAVFSTKREDGVPIWYYAPDYNKAHR